MKQESKPVTSFSQIKPGSVDQKSKRLQQFRDSFYTQHGHIAAEYHIGHPNLKLLLAFIFFTLAPDKAYTYKKVKSITALINENIKVGNKYINKIQFLRNKFHVDYDKNSSIVDVLKEKQQALTMNRAIIQQCINKLTLQNCYQLIVSITESLNSFTNINIHVEDEQTNKINKTNHTILNYIEIVEIQNQFFLIAYQILNKKQMKQQIRSSVDEQVITNKKQKIQERENEQNQRNDTKFQKNTKQRISSQNVSNQKQNIGDNYKKTFSLKQQSNKQSQQNFHSVFKSKSVGGQLSIIAQDNSFQVTWFQVFVGLIILLTLLSEFFGIFDDFLTQYNQKIGKYYLIGIGTKLSKHLSEYYK